MQARPGPAYHPERFTRGYSPEQILAHVGECLELYAKLDEEHSIDSAIAPSVFGVVQMMVAAVEPAEATAAAKGLALPGNGEASRLGIVGQG